MEIRGRDTHPGTKRPQISRPIDFSIIRCKHALSASDRFRLWDLDSGQVLHSFEGHRVTVWTIRFSPDGKRALSGSWDETMRLWDIESRKELQQFGGHEDRVLGVQFSPDGKQAVSSCVGDPFLRLWDLESGTEIRRFTGHTDGVTSLAFSPDGRWVLRPADS